MTDVYLDQKGAVLRYKLSKSWFERCRWAGNGPHFIKLSGNVLYQLKETDEWFNSHITTKSNQFKE